MYIVFQSVIVLMLIIIGLLADPLFHRSIDEEDNDAS